MVRVRRFRRIFAVSVTALLAVALSACDPTPVMISGTVTFEGSGAPAAGLVVTAFADGSETAVASATVGADGRFEVRESVLPGGDYRLRLGEGDWWQGADSWADAQPVTASAAAPAALDAVVSPGTIAGSVVDEIGMRASVTVEVVHPGTLEVVATTVSTHGYGDYSLTVPSGTYLVRFRGDTVVSRYHGDVERPDLATPVVVGAAQTVQITTILEYPRVMQGHLTDGAPVRGATVLAIGADHDYVVDQAVTDADGNFAITGLLGNYRLVVLRGTESVALPGVYESGPVGTIVMPGLVCTHPAAAPDANLSGADLSAADLRGCDLSGSTLVGTDLSGANLTGADLTGSNLFGADLTGTVMSGVTLTGVSSGGIVGSPVDLPTRWRVVVGALVGPGAHLPWAGFGGADLSGVDLTGAVLYGADLTGANLEDSILTGANLDGAAMTGTALSRVTSGGIVGTPTGLHSDWLLLKGNLVGPTAILEGADLAGVDLRDATLFEVRLSGADLSGADLSNMTIGPASLHGSNLSGVDVSGSFLRHVYTDGSEMRGANLAGAVFYRSSLARVDLTSSDLSGVDLSEGTGGGFGWGTSLHGSDLTGATLTGANLDGVDIAEATLHGLTTGAIRGTPRALPSEWALRAGHLVGPGASLRGAVLRSTDLSNLDLSAADLSSADLTGSDLSGSVLSGSNLTDASFAAADLRGAEAHHALLLRTDLSGAQLSGTDLRGGFLLSADLSGADLTSTDLSDAWLDGAVFDGALLADAIIQGAWFGGALLDGVISSGLVGQPFSLADGWSLADGALVSSA